MRSDIAPGGTFPDYELPDHTNVPRRLSELRGPPFSFSRSSTDAENSSGTHGIR